MKVVLKKGREKSILARNHWVFSGAIHSADAEDGSIADLYSFTGEFLGSGYYNSKNQIRMRLLSFGRSFDDDYLVELVTNAVEMRRSGRLHKDTDSYRLVFSEGDFLPGFIADLYGRHLIIQSLTLGMDALKDRVCEILDDLIKPESILEKSEHKGRELEGGGDVVRQVKGTTPKEIQITEHGVIYPIDPFTGQKTGFFLDQRDNRNMIMNFAEAKRVLNLFSYTGGFSFAALKGGATEAVSVDISADALSIADATASLNGFQEKHRSVKADVFDFVRKNQFDQDIIINDPPAFVKSKNSVINGCRGYKDVNLNIMKNCRKGTLLLTCSCSRFIDMDLFQKVVFAAAKDAGRNCRILAKSGHPFDHPVNIYNPETEYLKAILLHVE